MDCVSELFIDIGLDEYFLIFLTDKIEIAMSIFLINVFKLPNDL